MSDRTYIQLEILECPTQNVNAVIDLLEEFNYDIDNGVLQLNEQYSVEEATIGSLVYDLAPQLKPLCSFSGWEDPKYEFPGSGILHIRGLEGSYTFDCFQNGVPVFTEEQIRKAIADDMLDTLFGATHQNRTEDLREQFVGITLTATPENEVDA